MMTLMPISRQSSFYYVQRAGIASSAEAHRYEQQCETEQCQSMQKVGIKQLRF
jgi:hypothetical protein